MKKVFFLFSIVCFTLLHACNTPEAVTESGVYCGIKSTTHQEVDAYLGIEYATAKRWENAHLVQSHDRKNVFDYGPMCPQMALDFSLSEMDEACLYLNVWKPRNGNTDKLLPVIVYIHGGGFVSGSASIHGVDENGKKLYFYDAANLSGEGELVVVTVNYRLGAFGFLKTDENESGNYGLSDQVTALEWVKRNIKAFGGDPEKITLMGQSAGAVSVILHGTNPDLASQFKGVVAQSPYLGFKFPTAVDADEISRTFFTLLKQKCSKYLMTRWDSCRQFITTEDIMEVQKRIFLFNFAGKFIFNSDENLFPFNPYIDHLYVRGNPLDLTLNKHLSLMLGNTKNEANFMYPSMIEESFGQTTAFNVMKTMWNGELTAYASHRQEYRKATTPLSNLFNIIDDAVFVCPSEYFARQNAQAHPVYLYYYTFVSSYNALSTKNNPRTQCDPPAVCHAEDVPVTFKLFGTVDRRITPTSEELSFAQIYMEYIAHFAYTQSLPHQMPYDDTEDRWIVINNQTPYFHRSHSAFSKQFYCSAVWFPFYKHLSEEKHYTSIAQ